MSSLYIHIPFCKTKCLYCDFFSRRCVDKTIHSKFVDALCLEFAQRINELHSPINTIYIGGGTPSSVDANEIRRLLDYIFKTGSEYLNSSEITIEVNPDDVTEENAKTWKEAGINRVSMGIQSFDDNELHSINRRHSAKKAVSAYSILQKYFSNVSIDLIFGLPGQTLDKWKQNLRYAAGLAPQHISIYSLMYEPGTALTKLRDAGKIVPVADETSTDMFEHTNHILSDAGYSHYEISNFALPGYESKHNSGYWNRTEYLGLGPGAHSFDGKRKRKWNPSDINRYISNFIGDNNGNESPFYESENLTDTEILEETIMTSLRTALGINLQDYAQSFGDKELTRLLESCTPYIDKGMITLLSENNSDIKLNRFPGQTISEHNPQNPALVLTESGIMLSDNIILNLIP